MEKSQYQKLVLIWITLGLGGALVDFFVPSLLPDGLRKAQEEYTTAMPVWQFTVASLLGIPGFILALAATYGLYRFRPWAPRAGLLGTALALLSYVVGGATSQSGISSSVSFAASYVWGACLVLSLVAPCREWFVAESASKDAP